LKRSVLLLRFAVDDNSLNGLPSNFLRLASTPQIEVNILIVHTLITSSSLLSRSD
jgi:hypothetical protein